MSGAVVVTGASGFIGSAVIHEALRRGCTVLAVSRRAALIPGVSAEVKNIHVNDYSETPCPADAVLIHLAESRDIKAPSAPGEAEARMAALAAKPFSGIVYASSAVVYGDTATTPRRTTDPVSGNSAYAAAKLAVENLVIDHGGAVARIANLYGKLGIAPNTVISDVLRQLDKSGPVILNDLSPVRDFLHIDDAARALVDMAATRRPTVLNVGSGSGTTIRQLAETLLRLAGKADRPLRARQPAPDRRSYLVLDISETAAQIGWSPRIGLERGLAGLLTAAT